MKGRILILAFFIANTIFSQNYHDTQGKIEISNSGQATYSLPIALPASLQNVGPTINLVYASGQLGGVVGQGWNINSVSMISRMSTSMHVDGFVDGVDFDSNDKLALDGQRLLIKNGDYWADGSVYETEIQSNNKIELFGTGDSIYFIVTNTDGSRAWYGNFGGTNATDLTAFYITRFEDSHGNYILYDYYKPFGKSLCLKEIKFSANVNGILPINSMIFDYELAKRVETAYIKGVKHEKEAILTSVEVKTNGSLFRKYLITHSTDPILGYQKVIKIQEFNGEGESANPIEFEYLNTDTGNTEVVTNYNGFLQPQSGILPGDFDGDGYLDFYNEGKIYTKLFQGGSGTSINAQGLYGMYPIQTLSLDNKLNSYQSFTSMTFQLNQINININEINQTNNQVNTSYFKNISFPNSASIYSNCPNHNPPSNYIKTGNKYIEGDYNGDGISELLILSFPEQKVYQYDPNYETPETNNRTVDPSYQCVETITVGASPNVIRILDLNPNSSSVFGTKGYSGVDATGFTGLLNGKYLAGDFNRDGKTDIFVIREDKSYTIFSFKQLDAAPWTQIELIGNGTLSDYDKDKLLMFGDFNGDGKTDIIIPVEKNSDDWSIYFSNPKLNMGEVFEKETHQITTYKPDTGTPGTSGAEYTTQQHFKNYYVLDVNKDGKSDLVMYWVAYAKKEWWQYHNFDTKWQVSTFVNNIGNTNPSSPKFYLDYTSASEHNSDSPEIPVPIVSSFRVQGANRDFVVLRKDDANAHYIQFTRDYSTDILLSKVTSSNGGIVNEINYREIESLNNNGFGNLNDIYSSSNSEYYPNFEFKRLRGSKVVEKLKSNIDNVVKYQSYKYHGLTANLSGLGLIGYKKTARSSWYQNPSENNIIWSVFENDANLRGANVRNYTQLATVNDFVFNLSSPTTYITKTENEFIIANPSHPYALLLDKSTSYDFFTNVKSETSNEYSIDGFYIPKEITKRNFLGSTLQGTYIITTDYDNNVSGSGNTFYIGRPKSVVSRVDAYLDTFETTEKFTYTGNFLTKLEKKGNSANNEYNIEEYEYDNYGNIIKKTISVTAGITPYIAPKSIEQVYDVTGRFVLSSKDNEDLITNYTYDPIYGQVKTVTSPFNLTTTNFYDNWGKLIKIKDYLNKNINFTYSRSANINTLTTIGDDGSHSIKINDILGRTLKVGKKNIDDTWTYQSTEYDYLGRKFRESEPYKGANPTLWNTTIFDEYSRTASVNYASGLIVNLTYVGLKTIANDGTKQTSSTKNANGHVIQSTDPGGEINFTFYANGNQKTSTYEDNVVSMQYNDFGLKTQLSDPSAGTYTYDYNFIGQITHEGTPKGDTYYDYDSVTGRLSQKRVVGSTASERTSIITDYNYHPTNKMLESMTVTDIYNGNSSYLYEFDSYNRVYKTTENLPFTRFENEVIFDSFGRIEKTKYEAKELTTNKTSLKWVKNVYKNGEHYKILDDATNNLLWSSNTVNERGQLTGGTFGNNLIQSNTYDNLGFPTILNTSKIIPSARLSSGTVLGKVTEPGGSDDPIEIDPVDPQNTETLIDLSYSFNAQRALLNTRQTNLFNLFELFEYDNLERLTKWSSPDVTLHSLQFSGTVDGFVATPSASVSSFIGKLRVNTTAAASGAQKIILNNTVLGTKLNINATVNKNNTDKIRVVIVEKDPITNVIIETVLGEANEGLFTAEYVVSTYTDVYLKFDKSPLSTDVGVLKNFFVDNIIIKEINSNTQSYDDRGRITQNKVGSYGYNISGKSYQNSSVELSSFGKTYYEHYNRQDISYNAFKSPIQIHEQNIDKIDFSYNTFQNRSSMFYGNLATDKLLRTYRKHYSGDGSIEVKHNISTGAVEFLTYIGGDGYSAPVIYKDNGVTQEYLYLHRDLQGSIIAITNQAGNIVEKRHFDAWGKIAKVQDGAGNNLAGLTVIDRGYTGHEHLQSVGLIHMNGRLYDPVLHRFLQPDNFIQDSNNTQNYNRYSYVLNNPLKYTDPSGESALGAIAVGVAVGIATYMLNAIATEAPINFQGVLRTTIISLWSTGATMGISGGFASICGFDTATAGFWSGLGVGASTGFITGVFNYAANTFINGGSYHLKDMLKEGIISATLGGVIGGISGGVKANKEGSNFWSGKNNWKKIAGGVGFYSPEVEMSESIDLNDSNWRVKAELKNNFSRILQHGDIDCAVATKRMNDNYFDVNYNDYSEINTKAFDEIKKGNGLRYRQMDGWFKTTGYQTDSARGNNFQWGVNQMNKGRVLNVLWQTDSGPHWSPVYSIEQNIRTNAFRLHIYNPGPIGGDYIYGNQTVYGILSVWR